MSIHTFLITIADHKQGDLAAYKEKEQQLQAELDGKEQQISSLKEDLQATREMLNALRDESKKGSEQKELMMPQQKGKQTNAGLHMTAVRIVL